MSINTIQDAETLIKNSGYIDWAFESKTYTNDEIVNKLLPRYVYQKWDNDIADELDQKQLETIMCDFIEQILKQSLSLYNQKRFDLEKLNKEFLEE